MPEVIRLIALLEVWSLSYWKGVTHPDPAMRIPDRGPDRVQHLRIAAYDRKPSDEEVMDLLERHRASLPMLGDGFGVIRAYALLDAEAWKRLDMPGGRETVEWRRLEDDTLDRAKRRAIGPEDTLLIDEESTDRVDDDTPDPKLDMGGRRQD